MRNPASKFTALKPDGFSSRAIMLLLSFILLTSLMNAQSDNSSAAGRELHDKIASLDSALFEAFNACDLAKVETFFTEGVEFYHEKGGLITTRKSVIEAMKNNLCSENSNRVRRELVKGSLEVRPINNYGAVQTGEHRFYLAQKGGKERLDGIGKFVHIWQNKDGQWRISRVVSYGFRPGN
ncbi:MAG TPA: nuclear transport factor 2 family protein [Pyrinomonadaceae bacterium]|jgi:ketosteroid isomerase-like protein|nr:nuclear transport factor 2 family protein [Pyrinomonadaceae bacterium]